jgi:hypothetical protein
MYKDKEVNVSLTSSSGGYINGRNSANLELLIDKMSSIYLYVKLKPHESSYLLQAFEETPTHMSIKIDSGQLSTKIYDKRDDFNFKIINFPNIFSNIPASPAYGVYISQC